MSLSEGAKVIVETCMGIKPNENVLIITTKRFSKKAKLLAEQAELLGAKSNILTVDNEVLLSEPPEAIAKKMRESDVVLATLNLTTIQYFLQTNARNAAIQKGARVAAVPYIRTDITKEDVYKITELTEKLGEILTNGSEARISTNAGTNLVMSIKDRVSALLRVRHIVPGAFGAVPDYAEACIAPIEDKTEGIAIIDVFFEKVGKISNPVKITIENGRAVKIEGKEEAEKIRNIIKNADENGNVIAELGIGTNHILKQFTGTIGDKMIIGTAHIAIGKSLNIGGEVYSNIHHDGVMNNVTIEIDGQEILKDGHFTL